ncbi:MAG TPA: nicotinate phosphoribosyltransferase [Candidatus Nanoarchaeia archaeon]|nr:nicotinate phosphoribosyltransferase [Candidatus Nanoarchaeia archaeon]
MTNENNENRTMLTDLYQLTMNAAYMDSNKNDWAVFDLFIRKLPKDWGFFIANGIDDALDYATNIKFEKEDLEFLAENCQFTNKYIETLKKFRFTGDIYAVKEGTPVGANTPLMRIHAPRSEGQYLETMLLNSVNFDTMIATKANRIVRAAGDSGVIDMGLRRAQGKDAAMRGARAAYIAGAIGTSNVMAGKEFEIPIFGTQAHSFVMTYPTELEAFRAYVRTFPNKPTLLVDTYDTIQGINNAIIVGKEMESRGEKLGGIRLDSGDIARDSIIAREKLNSANLDYVRVVASNDLNEYKISGMINSGARVDGYGVGTEMITSKPVAAIPGVYKLVEDGTGAKIKLAPGKQTHPGVKQVYRCYNGAGTISHDVLALEEEQVIGTPLLEKVVENGSRIIPRRTLHAIREYCHDEVLSMPEQTKRLSAEQYEVKVSGGLANLESELRQRYGGRAA